MMSRSLQRLFGIWSTALSSESWVSGEWLGRIGGPLFASESHLEIPISQQVAGELRVWTHVESLLRVARMAVPGSVGYRGAYRGTMVRASRTESSEFRLRHSQEEAMSSSTADIPQGFKQVDQAHDPRFFFEFPRSIGICLLAELADRELSGPLRLAM
jgi:hypothetical protein